MSRLLKTCAVVALVLSIHNYSHAFDTNKLANWNYLAYGYNYKKLLAYSNNPIDNIFITPEINHDLSVAKVINDDFSLEMDLDVNSKKQLKPKANILPNEKRENSSKCVEKVIKPHLDNYKAYDEIVEEDVANLDIDKVVDVKDAVKKQKQERKEKLAKIKNENKERISWFNIFKRDKSKQETVAMQQEIVPEIDDIDGAKPLSNNKSLISHSENNNLSAIANDEFDIDNLDTQNVNYNNKINPEKMEPLKIQPEKPVKVAKENHLPQNLLKWQRLLSLSLLG